MLLSKCMYNLNYVQVLTMVLYVHEVGREQ